LAGSFLVIFHYDASAHMYDENCARSCARDPIGYEEGSNTYSSYFAMIAMDPMGNDTYTPGSGMPSVGPLPTNLEQFIEQMDGKDHIFLPHENIWEVVQDEKGYPRYAFPGVFGLIFGFDSLEHQIFMTGCKGVAACLAGHDAFSILANGDCFRTLDQARQFADPCKMECEPVIIGHTWRGGKDPSVDSNGLIVWADGAAGPNSDRYDFGFYDPRYDVMIHAQDSFNDGYDAIISKPSYFHDYHGSSGWQTVYCVSCAGSTPGEYL
jgi:hypothetical protein